MDYWTQGEGRAPNCSLAVRDAYAAKHVADEEVGRVLVREYPFGAAVRVVHYRGVFTGRVVGWDSYGARVIVQNDKTMGVCKWWAAHVELLTTEGGV